MRPLLAGSVLGVTTLLFACTDPPGATADGGAPDAARVDAGDAGVGVLGFRPSNLDNSPLEAALADPALGDVVLDDCGPQIDAIERGHVGCRAAGEGYVQIDGYGGTQKYAVFVARNIRVAADRVASVGGDRPLILVARESITLEGGIEVTEGLVGAAAESTTKDGMGPGGGKGIVFATGGTGGGGGFCGKGGDGGGLATVAAGGASYGNAEIVPLQGGSSGGGYLGARGGGAIQLVAGREIVIGPAAFIHARGDGAVSGGGSGGAILLEAKAVRVQGAVTANGGGGGAPGGQTGIPGGTDANPALGGRPDDHLDGGNGGAGTQVDGTNGVLNTAPPNDGTGSGSGGGGAGWVRINTQSGAAEVSGVVSPALGSRCGSQGTLR